MSFAGVTGSSATSKRRRTSMSSTASLASRGDDETGSVEEYHQTERETKRKRIIKVDPIEQCQQLYDIIRTNKKEDLSLLCEPFIRVPKRRQEPGYYEVVSNPMDMLRVQQKIKMDEYDDVEQMSADVDLMVTNAKAFYKRSSQEYKDACDLWDLFIDSKCRLFDRDSPTEDGAKGKIILKMGKLARRAAAVEARKPAGGEDAGETSESSTNTDKDKLEENETVLNNLEDLFSTVMLAADSDGRPLHTFFQLLPSKKRYPDYYNVIESPIDLKMIAMKIQTGIYSLVSKQGEYGSINELEKDLLLMCKNACQYNEPGSQIYKDAKGLKKIVSSKRIEIEHGRVAAGTPGKTSERIRNKRLKGGFSHSAVTAALNYEDEEEEVEEEVEEEQEAMEEEEESFGGGGGDEEEDIDGESRNDDGENPLWILYDTVNSLTGSGGTGTSRLADPFKRLPSRHFYPDYYAEIKNPISLAQIKMKIRKGEYLNITELQGDMNVMFENAKKYNRVDSSLYKTACKLQRNVQNKVQEILGIGFHDDVETSNDSSVFPKGNTNLTVSVGVESDSDASVSLFSPSSSSNLNLMESSNKSGISTSGNSKKIRKLTPTATPKSDRDSTGSSKSFNSFNKEITRDPLKESLKKKFQYIYKTLIEYTQPDGRTPISLFMDKPSRKFYPDYYKVIVEPIDMYSIENNIKNDKYYSTEELSKDFRLLFNNCRQYNEENSTIYEDANKLEKILNDKLRELGPDPGVKVLKKKGKRAPGLTLKQKKLLDAVKEFKDKNGRQLSLIFNRLPSKQEYPEYYEIIKNPMDLDRISNKVKTYNYESIETLMQDLMLMFDNASKFNEPDSQIYKDALILQRVALQTKLSLSEDDDKVPDVPGAVREMLTCIFTSVYNHQDEEGRCYSDTMAELAEYDEIPVVEGSGGAGGKERGLTLDLIKSRLDRGFYKRLDTFQKDMFCCFERAKRARTDSQLFEDAVVLQAFFIRARDEICGCGEFFKSPALNFCNEDLKREVEVLKARKKVEEVPQESEEDSASLLMEMEVKKEEGEEVKDSSMIQSEIYNEETYNIGDFVYVTSAPGESTPALAASLKNNIANIQKLWTEDDGTKMFEGVWFFRPDQTYHIPTRKFLEKEVFRSDVRSTAKLSEIMGRCVVMTVKGKEYFNYAPEGYRDDDVYVCEYRYSSKARSFTKIKCWPFENEKIKLIPRPKALEPIRICSVFKVGLGGTGGGAGVKDNLFMEEDLEKITKEILPDIELERVIEGETELIYYEQFNLPCGIVRVGDYVYVRVENGKKLIARVDSMWFNSNVGEGGGMSFHGPWFTTLSEIQIMPDLQKSAVFPPGRVFYKQEIFQSSIEDTNPLLSICGFCKILDVEEYSKMRHTEIPEEDVFVCESLYDEAKRIIKKFEGLKKFEYRDNSVHEDEIYYFRRQITLPRIDADGNVIQEVQMPKLKIVSKMEPPGSPMTSITSKAEVESLNEDSLDSYTSPPSLVGVVADVVNSLSLASASSSSSNHPVTTTPKKAKTGKKIVTGYILFSSEVRKHVAEKNPTSNFGEISRIVGNDWRKMTILEKQVYEERAGRLNEEKEIAAAAGIELTPKTKENTKQDNDIIQATNALKKDPDWIFECCWDKCDWQFEDALDLIEHCVQEPKGHVSCHFKNTTGKEGEFQCHWKNCQRVKKGVNPFPTLSRLLKHVRDIHILKGNGRIIHPEMRSKNIQLSRSTIASIAANEALAKANKEKTSSTLPSQPQQQVIIRPPPPPQEPLFVAIPPRPQKLVHSEAYIRYIESLHNEQRYMTNWGKTLKATVENTPTPDREKLPTSWLANGVGNHGSMEKALWALRDFMIRDALNLRKVTE